MEVLRAINRVQAQLAKEGISKERKNQAQGYSFRGIDDMYNVLAPLLASNEIVLLPSYTERQVVERENAKGTALFYVTLRGDFTLRSSKDGSEVKGTTYGEAMDSGDKATNKAMSAALKYFFMQTFTIPTEGDNDTETQTHEVAAPKKITNPLSEMKADAFNLMPKEEQEFLRKLAADTTALVQEGREAEAFGVIEHNNLDTEEKLALWYLLDSKTRAAVKRAGDHARRVAKAESEAAHAGAH